MEGSFELVDSQVMGRGPPDVAMSTCSSPTLPLFHNPEIASLKLAAQLATHQMQDNDAALHQQSSSKGHIRHSLQVSAVIQKPK